MYVPHGSLQVHTRTEIGTERFIAWFSIIIYRHTIMLIDVKVKILEMFYIIQKQISNINCIFSKVCYHMSFLTKY
jgi:hypothetical protein